MMQQMQIIIAAPLHWHQPIAQLFDGCSDQLAYTKVTNVYDLVAELAQFYIPNQNQVVVATLVDYLDKTEMTVFETLHDYTHVAQIAIATSGKTMATKLLHAQSCGAAHQLILNDTNSIENLQTIFKPLPAKVQTAPTVTTEKSQTIFPENIEAILPSMNKDNHNQDNVIDLENDLQTEHLSFEAIEEKLADEMPSEISRDEYNAIEITDKELDALLGKDKPKETDRDLDF